MKTKKSYKFFILTIYISLAVIGALFLRENQFNILMLSVVVSLFPKVLIPLEKNVLFIGVCVLLSYSTFLLISYLNSDFKSAFTFSYLLVDYFLLTLLNWYSIKRYNRGLDIISFAFITTNSSILDIFYFIFKITIIIVWTYIFVV